MFAVGAYVGYLALGHVQLRVEALAGPVRPRRAAPSRSCRASTAWPGAGWSAAASGQGNPQITPLSYSDFILPSIGEELGLTGVMAVILLYGILVERGLRTALICRDDFGKLMAAGLAVVFALQVFVVIGGVTKLIPLTGLTTPFLSYGGSQPGRQLGDHRAAAAHLRPGPPPTAGAGRARRGLRRRRHPGGEDPQMNKPIRNLAVACMLLFVALLVNATYVQYWQADDLTSLSKHPDNKRVRDAEFSRERGAILVRGKAVAESNKSDDAYKFQRVYPQGPEYAHLTGYFSRDCGPRRRRVDARTPSCPAATPSCSSTGSSTCVDNESPEGRQRHPDRSTPTAQQAAYDGLQGAGRRTSSGAVVAIEPRTGKILAMVSSPTLQPQPAGQPRLHRGRQDQAAPRGRTSSAR